MYDDILVPTDGSLEMLGPQARAVDSLTLESGETVDVFLDDVDVDEDRGFHAEGRHEAREMLFELTTGPQAGGPIRLRRRPLQEAEWEDVGRVTDAVKVG